MCEHRKSEVRNGRRFGQFNAQYRIDDPNIALLGFGDLAMQTRWVLTFAAINPRMPESTWQVGIAERRYRLHQHKGNGKALGRIFLIGEILQGGTAGVRRGWSRPGKDDCFVYWGFPKSDYKSLNITTPAPKGMAFCVFVLDDGTIDEWTWRPVTEVEGVEGCPDGVNGELIWPQNKKSANS